MKKVIDVSSYLNNIGKIQPDREYEIDLLKMYNFQRKPFNKFTKWLLNQLYNDDVDHSPIEISTFYNVDSYNSMIVRLLCQLDNIIIGAIKEPNFSNIEFIAIKERTDTTLLIEVKIH
jgi:hypothetical protein